MSSPPPPLPPGSSRARPPPWTRTRPLFVIHEEADFAEDANNDTNIFTRSLGPNDRNAHGRDVFAAPSADTTARANVGNGVEGEDEDEVEADDENRAPSNIGAGAGRVARGEIQAGHQRVMAGARAYVHGLADSPGDQERARTNYAIGDGSGVNDKDGFRGSRILRSLNPTFDSKEEQRPQYVSTGEVERVPVVFGNDNPPSTAALGLRRMASMRNLAASLGIGTQGSIENTLRARFRRHVAEQQQQLGEVGVPLTSTNIGQAIVDSDTEDFDNNHGGQLALHGTEMQGFISTEYQDVQETEAKAEEIIVTAPESLRALEHDDSSDPEAREDYPVVFPQVLAGSLYGNAQAIHCIVLANAPTLSARLAGLGKGPHDEAYQDAHDSLVGAFFSSNCFRIDRANINMFLDWAPHYPRYAARIRRLEFCDMWSHDIVRKSRKIRRDGTHVYTRTTYKPFRILAHCPNVLGIEMRWWIGKCPGFTGQEQEPFKALREKEMAEVWDNMYHVQDDFYVNAKNLEVLQFTIAYSPQNWGQWMTEIVRDTWIRALTGYWVQGAMNTERMCENDLDVHVRFHGTAHPDE